MCARECESTRELIYRKKHVSIWDTYSSTILLANYSFSMLFTRISCYIVQTTKPSNSLIFPKTTDRKSVFTIVKKKTKRKIGARIFVLYGKVFEITSTTIDRFFHSVYLSHGNLALLWEPRRNDFGEIGESCRIRVTTRRGCWCFSPWPFDSCDHCDRRLPTRFLEFSYIFRGRDSRDQPANGFHVTGEIFNKRRAGNWPSYGRVLARGNGVDIIIRYRRYVR